MTGANHLQEPINGVVDKLGEALPLRKIDLAEHWQDARIGQVRDRVPNGSLRNAGRLIGNLIPRAVVTSPRGWGGCNRLVLNGTYSISRLGLLLGGMVGRTTSCFAS